MTINTASNKTIVLGNASQTQFAFGFVGVSAAYIAVIYTDASGNETVLSAGTGASQYQITLNPPVAGAVWGIGGSITYNPGGTPIAAGTSLTIFRTLPLTQAISLQNLVSVSTLGTGAETGLDTLEMQLQQIAEEFGRSLVAPITDPPTINLTLPGAAQRANTSIAFDAFGNVITGTAPATGLISSAMQPVVNAVTINTGAYLLVGTNFFSTFALAASASVPAAAAYLRLGGYTTPGDLGAALYKKVVSGGYQLTTVDGATWAIAETAVTPQMFGALGDGATNDNAAINACLAWASSSGAVAIIPGNRSYNNGNGVITVPDNTTVLCGSGAALVRSVDAAGAAPYQAYTQALIVMGNYCRWTGGTLSNTAVLGTSNASNTIATGTITFIGTTAGLPLTNLSFVRIWSRANPANNFEGPVTSYSGTTLVLNAQADSGSGTFSDWNITFGAVYQAPMVLHGVTETTIENVRVTGNWYAGVVMDGWNPATGGALLTSFCTIRNCFLENVQNRGIYLYGTCNDNVIADCYIAGGSGITNYGLNCDPANATGTVNSQSRNKFTNITVDAASFQGIELGDQCYYAMVTNCTAVGLTNAAGVGFLVQYANGLAPQYNNLIGCSAIQCPTGFNLAGCLYTSVVGGSAVGGTTGYIVENDIGTAQENSLQDILAAGNVTGISVNTGAANTLLTGRAVANSGNNLIDSGSGTIHGNLVTT